MTSQPDAIAKTHGGQVSSPPSRLFAPHLGGWIQPKSTRRTAAAAAIEHFFETPSNYSHARNVAALVLEPYGAGYAWLPPSTDAAEDEDALYVPTDAGRNLVARIRAQEALFARPWPTVAEVS